MAEENSMARGSSDCPSNEAQDLRDQGGVLIHVLTLYPTHLRLSELIQEVSAGVADFAQRDAIERAVRDLIGVGLLFRSDGLPSLPTSHETPMIRELLNPEGLNGARDVVDEQGQAHSKVIGRKRDAETFDTEVLRRKRTGDLDLLTGGSETLADFAEEWWKLYAVPNPDSSFSPRRV